jgi:tRNA(adenine34) deaminase
LLALEMSRDDFYMAFALEEARMASRAGEVPVGAVVVINEDVIGRGYNQPIRSSDPTAHAEIIAIRDAAARAGNYRLTGATLYATIEPCAMCAGAMINARIGRVVFGARDVRAGGVKSVFEICSEGSLNHQVEVVEGVRADEARILLQEFFRLKR